MERKEEKHPLYVLLNLSRTLRLRLIGEGLLVGLFAGLVVSLYRLVLQYAGQFSTFIYGAVRHNGWLIVLCLIALALIGLLVGFLVKSEPMIKGSGIPQVEGTLHGFFSMCWWKVLIKKFIGGVLSIGAGLSLGREGPSIQIGAVAGQGVSRLFKRMEVEEKYLITCGASAGLAAAFNAPFAGLIFALEEVHKNFSPGVLLSAMAASIAGDLVSKQFFGTAAVFGIETMTQSLPLRYYLLLLLLGALLGVCGALYNQSLTLSQKFYASLRFLPEPARMILPFLLAGIVGILLPLATGGGHNIIEGLLASQFTVRMIVLLLFVKFVFSMLSYGSGAPGGIFLPLLVLGALIGALFGHAAVSICGVPAQYINNFLLLGMVGMFTAIVRAPITGIILIVEMSGSLTHMLALTVVAIASYVVADMLKAKPVYEMLLHGMLKNGGSSPKVRDVQEKTLIEIPVPHGCAVAGKRVDRISWPHDSLLVSIERLGVEIIPKGDTVIQAGDYIVLMGKAGEEAALRAKLRDIVAGKHLKKQEK